MQLTGVVCAEDQMGDETGIGLRLVNRSLSGLALVCVITQAVGRGYGIPAPLAHSGSGKFSTVSMCLCGSPALLCAFAAMQE